MIKEIETHCEDVICLSQNFLDLPVETFQAICDSGSIQQMAEKSTELIEQKQIDVSANLEDVEEADGVSAR